MPKLHNTELFLRPNGDGLLYVEIRNAITKEPYGHIMLDEIAVMSVRGKLTKFLETGQVTDA